jgi:hypothetical protein
MQGNDGRELKAYDVNCLHCKVLLFFELPVNRDQDGFVVLVSFERGSVTLAGF